MEAVVPWAELEAPVEPHYPKAGSGQQRHSHNSGTIVDPAIVAAPSSTDNSTGERAPETHRTKKGNQWHFGMKAHIGVIRKRERRILSARRRPAFPMCICCLTYRMARRRKSGAMRGIKGRPRRFARPRPMRKI
jgi:hypothetical protein